MTPKQVKDIFDKLPSKRRKVLEGFLAGHSREKIMIDADVPSDAALTGHLKELYKNFRIVTGWNDADDPRSGTRKLPSLIALFAKYMPELISDRIPDVLDGVEQEDTIAKPPQESVESDAGSIEERIFQAINQLDPKYSVFSRMRGIHALGEIAEDYPRYHWNLLKIVAAFVKENASYLKTEEVENKQSVKPDSDVQAALTVIGKSNREKDPENDKLDLSHIDIAQADLSGADLRRVILVQVKLSYANLRAANLQGANLRATNLQWADLSGANLQGADLSVVNLERATLVGANLQGATLVGANLQGAILHEANLQEVQLHATNLQESSLIGAKLQGANLRKTKNLLQHQIESAYGDSTTVLPDMDNIERPAHWM